MRRILFLVAGVLLSLGAALVYVEPLRAFPIQAIFADGPQHATTPSCVPLVHAYAQSTDTNNVSTPARNTTGATLYVVAVSHAVITPTISDSVGNSYSAGQQFSDASGFITALWYKASPTTGAAVVVTASSTAQFPAIGFLAFSNHTAQDTASSGATSASATTLQPGSITPTGNNRVVIAALGDQWTGTVSIDSGMTVIDQGPSGGGTSFALATACVEQTTAGAINGTWTQTGSAAPLVAIQQAFQ